MKLNLRQTAVLAEVIIYCFGRYLKKNPPLNQVVQPIPVKKLFYDRHHRNDRQLILKGINVWFELEQQGKQGMSSIWRARPDAYLTDEVLDCLKRYYEQNIQHFLALKTFANTKKDEQPQPPTSKFSFDSPLEAQMFLEVVGKLVT